MQICFCLSIMSRVFGVIFTIIAMFRTTFASSSSSNILPGSTLYASDPNSKWNSLNKTFILSFIPYPEDTSVARRAAITFDNNRSSIPIWVAGANSANRGVVDGSATLRFLHNGNLELRNGSSNTLVWQSSTSGRSISFATLEESGNFILRNATGFAIWSSFDNPTDTIVPSQTFTNHHVLRNGMYSFKLSSNGNVNLLWNDSILYYNSRLGSSGNVLNIYSPSISILPIGILVLNDGGFSSPINLVYSSDFDGKVNHKMRFVKLDADGNLRIYSFDRASGSKNTTWSAVTDQCRVFGFCGDMGICSYNSTGPICSCPSENFVQVDPRDSTKGCRRKVELSNCLGKETMLTLHHTQVLIYPPELSNQRYTIPISACRLNCLVTDVCLASTSLSDGSEYCNYQLVGGFVSGYQSFILPSTSFIKVCPPISLKLSAETKKSRDSQVWLLAVVVVVTISCVVMLQGTLWFRFFRNTPKFRVLSDQHAPGLDFVSGMPVRFSYMELQRATNWFKDKLGVGEFGAVYKGTLVNGTLVAVKKLEGTSKVEEQFWTEVATISSTHHLNLVRLIGFCYQGRHRFLVYEYMSNGSLDNFIFSSEGQSEENLMKWECRYNIALGTARGIAYLHEECPNCILHCDIKPENILLDENYKPKVSDFGIARRMQFKDHRHDQTQMDLRRTGGYLAPEFLSNLPPTSKSDVYSYGIVLLEIVSGRRNSEFSSETDQKKFPIWAYEEFEKGNAKDIVDKRLLLDGDLDMEQAMRAMQVSFWCIQEETSQRPMMSKVVQMLEGVIEIHRPPNVSGVGLNASDTKSSTQFNSSRRSLRLSLSLSWSQKTRRSTSSASRKKPESSTSSLLWSEITTN